MNLAHLAGDIFSQIALYDCGSALVLTLLKCGNGVLSKKICDWVFEIDLEDWNLASTSRYPKILSSLHKLRVLRLERAHLLAPSMVLSAEVMKLPPTLTELTLTSDHPFDAFRDPTSHLVEHPWASGAYEKSHESLYWNIASRLPLLRKLVIKPLEIYDNIVVLSYYVLKTLPPTIEHLELLRGHLPSGDFLQALPRLHTLKVASFSINPQWPPLLTRLEGSFGGSPSDANAFYASLPSSLITIPIYGELNGLHRMLPLPSSLQEFHLPSVRRLPSEILDWLPSTLTTLDLSGLGIKLTAATLLSLPPGLTDLRCHGFDWNAISAYLDTTKDFNYDLFWPRQLRHIIFRTRTLRPKDPSVPLHHYYALIGALPTSLTEVSGLDDLVYSGPERDAFPFPHIKTLSLQGEQPFPKHIPLSLESLTWIVDYNVDVFLGLKTLNLTTLDLRMHVGEGNEPPFDLEALFGCFPPTLRTLQLRLVGAFLDSPNAWAMLPTTLMSLNLDCWTENTTEPPKSSHILPHLPPNLALLTACLADLPTPSDILGMPCYNKLRFIQFGFPQHPPRFTDKEFDECAAQLDPIWPECAVHGKLVAAGSTRVASIVERGLEYPDPRVIKSLASITTELADDLPSRANQQQRDSPTPVPPPRPLKVAKTSSMATPHDSTL